MRLVIVGIKRFNNQIVSDEKTTIVGFIPAAVKTQTAMDSRITIFPKNNEGDNVTKR
jgi:hypothetical protein